MSDPVREARKRVDLWLRAGGTREGAVGEASRIALFAAVPDMQRSHDTVRRGDAPRTSGAPAAGARQATRVHEVFFVVAVVLGLLVPGLVALSPRGGSSALSLNAGMIPAGLCALATLGLFVWLEPYRRSSAFFAGHNAPPRLYLVYGIVWTLLAASIVLLRWDEVDDPAPVIIGILMMLAAAAGTVPLWLRARKADAAAETTVDAHAGDPDMSHWWRDVDGVLTPQERDAVQTAYSAALDRLQERKVLTEADAAAAATRGPQAAWKSLAT
ncbi:hypothetical protein [Microbacterium sulfonylureivorans]|uniref:hypothetical protein n=1 Tax=Microbacterium sulfonylureivorans TaxID=2486854 RepID=UPI0013DEE93B|nr:hypothetical protein [Microbacterium sulfonylureivorans]